MAGGETAAFRGFVLFSPDFGVFKFQEMHLMLYTHRLWKGETASEMIFVSSPSGWEHFSNLFLICNHVLHGLGAAGRGAGTRAVARGGGVPERSALVRRPRAGGTLQTSRAVKWSGAGARQVCAPRTSPTLIALNDSPFRRASL